MRRSLFAALVAVLVSAAPAAAQSAPASPKDDGDTKTLNLTAYAELLRSDVRLTKVAIITELMGFTAEEDKAFWPIYREYDREMEKLGDERVALIADYAKAFDSLTDTTADKLARTALDLEAKRQALKAKFYERVRGTLKPKTALRALQIEHQLQLLIDLQVAASLPVAGR